MGGDTELVWILGYKVIWQRAEKLGAVDVIVGENSRKLPSYEEPPVTEVVCSVLFKSIEEFLSPHIGLLWQRFQPEYPFCNDVAPITPRIEVFNQPEIEPIVELSDIPPLPRVCLFSNDGTKIIQIQRDRFIHNWRKISPESEYPRYKNLIQRFQEYLSTFDDFLVEAQLEPIQPLQYELTYVNQIPQGDTWSTLEDIGNVFPDLTWNANSQRFLSPPQRISWSTVFELPDELGRLHASVKYVVLNNHPTLLLQLTVRGIGSYTSREALQNWFDIGHEWIVRAFADLTEEGIQTNIWKRRE
ncbi:MAG: TIGR04255 family protein [Coleofasciculus sp. G3-WIS-01]|uniref:TIGR04255 family protein n=1 Tax=Coleofasciculus sp. G3-WIS-01 TaxID=3069528 RepID=UPI0032F1E815